MVAWGLDERGGCKSARWLTQVCGALLDSTSPYNPELANINPVSYVKQSSGVAFDVLSAIPPGNATVSVPLLASVAAAVRAQCLTCAVHACAV